MSDLKGVFPLDKVPKHENPWVVLVGKMKSGDKEPPVPVPSSPPHSSSTPPHSSSIPPAESSGSGSVFSKVSFSYFSK